MGAGKLATLDDAGAVVFALPCTLTKAIGSFERCQEFDSSGARKSSTCDDSFCFREVTLPDGGVGWVPDYNMTAGQGSTNLTAAPAPQCAADPPAPSVPTESIPSNNVTGVHRGNYGWEHGSWCCFSIVVTSFRISTLRTTAWPLHIGQ